METHIDITVDVLFYFLSLPKDMLNDFRERGREGEREREKY